MTKEVANLGFGSLAADHPHCAALVRHTNDFGILPLLYLQYVIIWNTVKGLLSPLCKTDRPGHDPATRTDTSLYSASQHHSIDLFAADQEGHVIWNY
jgi:hypothetical protein